MISNAGLVGGEGALAGRQNEMPGWWMLSLGMVDRRSFLLGEPAMSAGNPRLRGTVLPFSPEK